MRVPLFVETLEGTSQIDLQICRKLAAHLLKSGISPLPFAKSMDELITLLHTLKHRNQWPAILIVNTYWAEEILRDMDALVEDTPILLFHRALTPTYKPGGDPDCLLGLHDAFERRLALKTYGSKNAALIAESCCKNVLNFLKTNDFNHIKVLDTRDSKLAG